MHFKGYTEGDRQGGMTLTTFTCRCGYVCQHWLDDGETGRCLDCREEDRRAAAGGVRVFRVVTA